jgi:hypothetical protein
MRFVTAVAAFAISLLLNGYIAFAIMELVEAEGLSAVPYELLYVWPNALVIATCLGLGAASFCTGVCAIFGPTSTTSTKRTVHRRDHSRKLSNRSQ